MDGIVWVAQSPNGAKKKLGWKHMSRVGRVAGGEIVAEGQVLSGAGNEQLRIRWIFVAILKRK